jgi:AAT family amino acid transporter
MSADVLRPRWGQPLTGIVATVTVTLIAWILWFIFSDPRGPVGAFPYPFVMYLAMMILVGLWQHMILGDWPVQHMPQPVRGIVQTITNLVVVWFVLHVVFERFVGLSFNFLSQANLDALAASGQAIMANGEPMTLADMQGRALGQRAVVAFVLIGFYAYPFITILFGKWPIRPSNLAQPQAGIAELAIATCIALASYLALIAPFFLGAFDTIFTPSIATGASWWASIAGTGHVHWVFGWWEWMIVVLFMTANVWRGKPWSLIALPQPAKGLVATALNVALGYALAVICVQTAHVWLPEEAVADLAGKNDLTRFL